MQKKQTYKNMQLISSGIKELDDYLTGPEGPFSIPHASIFAATLPGGAGWHYDTFGQFLENYKQADYAAYERFGNDYEVEIINYGVPSGFYCNVRVRAPEKETIEKIFRIIEKYKAVS